MPCVQQSVGLSACSRVLVGLPRIVTAECWLVCLPYVQHSVGWSACHMRSIVLAGWLALCAAGCLLVYLPFV